MSKMFKSLDFLNANTVKNLVAPTQDADAVRLLDLNNLNSGITQALTTSVTEEAEARASALSSLTAELEADIETVQSSYQAADASLQASLNTRINEISSGFAVREPVYAILTAQVTLEGLTVTTPSFTGVLPDGARVLTNAQGGNTDTAHIDNRVWIVAAGAWIPATDLGTGTAIDRAFMVSVQNGPDEFNDSIFILVSPVAPYTNATIGTTALKWSRWQSIDRILADDVTLVRNGATIAAKLDSSDLTVNANGIAVSPQLKTLLRDLSNATGDLPVAQVSGLLAYLAAITLNQLATPTSDVSLGGNKVTNLANPSSPTDAVNLQTLGALELPVGQIVGLLTYVTALSLSQLAAPTADLSLANHKLTNVAAPSQSSDAVNLETLNNAIASQESSISASKYAGNLTAVTVVDGDSVFTVTHNFGSRDFAETIYDKDTGETVSSDFFRINTSEDLNTCKVIFRNQANISTTKYRILLIKVA